ncbi:MAG: CCA tRNA nucleotidyltransferase [Candidatus Micrarchaeota archaeon]
MVKQELLYERIFSEIALRVSPTAKEAAMEKEFAEGIRKKLQKALGKKANLFFVGSTARDTGIRGDRDIDIFVAFPKGKSKEEIVKTTITTVKRILPAKWEMHYAEHPYLQAKLGNFKVEIVPCFKIKVNEGIISAVDRTPLHALYLQKHLTQKQKRDVRVLKALLKAHEIYGAELEIEGFSGLVCEYLVLNYRSLSILLSEASKWKPPVILDIEDYYDQQYEPLIQKYKSPLIIIDFIDRNRNAAAAISRKSFDKFVSLSKAFLSNPSEKWFRKPEITFTEKELTAAIMKRNFLLLKMRKPSNLVDDIIIPQLRKSERALATQLELADFEVEQTASFQNENESYILLDMRALILPTKKTIFGPPVEMEENVGRFMAAHPKPIKGPYKTKGRLAVDIKRKSPDAAKLLAMLIRNPASAGVASHFIKPMNSARLLSGHNLLYELKKNSYLQVKIAELLFSKPIR